MKTPHVKSLLFLFVCILHANLLLAQNKAKSIEDEKDISSAGLLNNDERMVLKVTDSIGKIRVAHMESNDAMPGSKGITETPARVSGLQFKNGPVVYVLRTPDQEFVLSPNDFNRLVEVEWIKRLAINNSPEVTQKYKVGKSGSVVYVKLKSENLKEALDRLKENEVSPDAQE